MKRLILIILFVAGCSTEPSVPMIETKEKVGMFSDLLEKQYYEYAPLGNGWMVFIPPQEQTTEIKLNIQYSEPSDYWKINQEKNRQKLREIEDWSYRQQLLFSLKKIEKKLR